MARIFLIAFWGLAFVLPSYAQQLQCGTAEKMEAQLATDPGLRAAREQIEDFTQRWIEDHSEEARAVYTIPVVVHIVYRTEAQNISDAQVQSQIDVLNEDYRAQNSDISGVPSVWTDRVADCELQFALAERTPDGFETNGITRTETTVTSWNGSDDVKFTSLGGHDAWDPSRYLNIWVCNIGAGLLGYAYQPGITPSLDGVVIGYKYFGRPSASTSYDLGRTTTHEIAHYFNLDHLWGPGGSNTNCTADDGVADTPRQQEPNFGCSTTYPHETCGNGVNSDMFNNFLDYGNDECIFFFTNGQKNRMLAALNGPRASLKNSDGLTPPQVGISEQQLAGQLVVYPNPATGQLHIRLDRSTGLTAQLRILDLRGRTVMEQTRVNLGLADHTLTLDELNPGTYVLEMTTENERVSKKINIVR